MDANIIANLCQDMPRTRAGNMMEKREKGSNTSTFKEF